MSCSGSARVLPAFPTRRSSDLAPPPPPSARSPVGDHSGPTPHLRCRAAAIGLVSLGVLWRFKLHEHIVVAAAGLAGLALWPMVRSEEHTSELQSLAYLVCRLLL